MYVQYWVDYWSSEAFLVRRRRVAPSFEENTLSRYGSGNNLKRETHSDLQFSVFNDLIP